MSRWAGGPTPTWTSYLVANNSDSAYGVHIADVDGDGLRDILAASEFDDKVRERGGVRGEDGEGGGEGGGVWL